MIEKTQKFFQEIEKLLDEADEMKLSDFTYDLLDCIYSDIVSENINDFSKNTVEGYINEIENSLKIFNPELNEDIFVLEKMLNLLETYLEIE